MTSGLEQTASETTVDLAAARSARRAYEARDGLLPDGRAARVTAVVLATAAARDGGPAALLPCDEGTLVRRLLAQLVELGVVAAEVITRPHWEPQVREAVRDSGVELAVRSSETVADDLRHVAGAARARPGALVVAMGHVLVHGQALAKLLADTRVLTAVLAKTRPPERPAVFGTRASRGRLLSAGSAYHSVTDANASFLGVLRVGAIDRELLADTAERLAELATPPLPADWERELERKAQTWSADGGPDSWAELASEDVASLLLVGLVRAGVHITSAYVRAFFWASPLSRAEAREAAREAVARDQDYLQMESAVKETDGFFTTFFVSPYSKYIARWTARRGLTPNQVTIFSMAIGVGAAAAFATGSRLGLVLGAVLVQLAFTFDCVDGQLARYARHFSNLGGWLDSILDRAKEYTVFAGLAFGSAHGRHDDVWVLACAALALQTARHFADFSFGSQQRQASAVARHPPLEQAEDEIEEAPVPMPVVRPWRAWFGAVVTDRVAAATRRMLRPPAAWAMRVSRAVNRWRSAIWIKRMIWFPIGERFAVISVTAALATPRVTFIVLLAWGGVAALYASAGRVVRGLLLP